MNKFFFLWVKSLHLQVESLPPVCQRSLPVWRAQYVNYIYLIWIVLLLIYFWCNCFRVTIRRETEGSICAGNKSIIFTNLILPWQLFVHTLKGQFHRRVWSQGQWIKTMCWERASVVSVKGDSDIITDFQQVCESGSAWTRTNQGIYLYF